MNSLQQYVPELASVVLCYAGLESDMTAWTSMKQMVPNMASVTGLTWKTFHPFVCPLLVLAEIPLSESHFPQADVSQL